MGVASDGCSCQGGFLHWMRGFGTCVPKEDLSAVRAANDDGGVKGGEFGGQDI